MTRLPEPRPPDTNPLPTPELTPDPNPPQPPLPLRKEERTWEPQDAPSTHPEAP